IVADRYGIELIRRVSTLVGIGPVAAIHPAVDHQRVTELDGLKDVLAELAPARDLDAQAVAVHPTTACAVVAPRRRGEPECHDIRPRLGRASPLRRCHHVADQRDRGVEHGFSLSCGSMARFATRRLCPVTLTRNRLPRERPIANLWTGRAPVD